MKAEQNATKSDNSTVDAIDAKLVLFLLETPAITDQELAEKLGLSRQTVNRRRNGAPVQKLLRTTLSIPEKEIRRITAKALIRLEAFLDHEDPKIKLAATLALVKLNARLLSDGLSLGFW